MFKVSTLLFLRAINSGPTFPQIFPHSHSHRNSIHNLLVTKQVRIMQLHHLPMGVEQWVGILVSSDHDTKHLHNFWGITLAWSEHKCSVYIQSRLILWSSPLKLLLVWAFSAALWGLLQATKATTEFLQFSSSESITSPTDYSHQLFLTDRSTSHSTSLSTSLLI